MFKSVSFNIFEENLQGIVYKSVKKDMSGAGESVHLNAVAATIDEPIPPPVPDFWRPNFISKFINYKSLSRKRKF